MKRPTPTTLMPNYLSSLDKAASKNWRVRQNPMQPGDVGEFILEADKLDPSHPYNIQVMGEDKHPKLYPPEMARADAELCAILRNNVHEIIRLIKADADRKKTEAAKSYQGGQ